MENKLKEFQPALAALIIALGIILSSMHVTKGIIQYQKMQHQSITVTGSASEKVTSDLGVLNISFKTQAPTIKQGYSQIKSSQEKIKAYFIKSGIDEKSINFGQISNYEVFKRIGNYTTNDVDFYRFNSSVNITSKDIKLISKLSDSIQDIANLDILIDYTNVQYFVSNLDDIKIKMVGEASKDAKKRAQSMVKSTGGRIGAMNSAKMGVFQIVPVNSTEVSDYGINDTSSIEKKVIAVVNATFTVK